MNFSVVGYGRLAKSLIRGLQSKGSYLSQLILKPGSPSIEAADENGIAPATIDSLSRDVQAIFLAVPDAELPDVSEEVYRKLTEGSETDLALPAVIHFSGSKGLNVFGALQSCDLPLVAWHPMQSFPSEPADDRFDDIVVGVTCNELGFDFADKLCELLGCRFFTIEEHERAAYHHASVLVSNFLPLLLELGVERLTEIGLDEENARKALIPLMSGMMRSLEADPTLNSATGPVVRGDIETVAGHINSEPNSDRETVYRALNWLFIKRLNEKGTIDMNKLEDWLEFLSGEEDEAES